jgi:hypothetical protein
LRGISGREESNREGATVENFGREVVDKDASVLGDGAEERINPKGTGYEFSQQH